MASDIPVHHDNVCPFLDRNQRTHDTLTKEVDQSLIKGGRFEGKHRLIVGNELKRDFGMTERGSVDRLIHMPEFRRIGFQKFLPRRNIEEKILHSYRCARFPGFAGNPGAPPPSMRTMVAISSSALRVLSET